MGQRATAWSRRDRAGRPAETVRPVLTVQEVGRLLRRSRRQIYRYLRAGRLRPCARILGQWLFGPEEVRRFREGGLPRFLRPLFWDVRLADLSAEHHRDFILARLLESGDRRALRWLLQAYPRGAIRDFLERRGRRVLSRRAWNFCALQVGVVGRADPGRRRRDQRWPEGP